MQYRMGHGLPFYNIVLPHYVHPMAMVAGSLVVTALFSPRAAAVAEGRTGRARRHPQADRRRAADRRAAQGIHHVRTFDDFAHRRIDHRHHRPLLVLLLSVLLGMDRFTELKVAGLLLGMAGAVAVVLTGASSSHQHSHVWGNVMIMLCACATALYMVWFKALVARYRITTVLRWVYCVAAVVALPFGLKEIIHTDYAAIAGHALFPTLFVADGADLSAEPDAELCAQERAGHGVEHLYLPAACAGDRHFGRDGAGQAACRYGGLRAGDLRRRGARAAFLLRAAPAIPIRRPRRTDPGGESGGIEQSGMRVGRTRGVPVSEFGETNIGTEYCLNAKKGEPLALLFYGAMSCRAEPLQPPADYSAAVTENLMTALTSLWSLAVVSYSPTVLMPLRRSACGRVRCLWQPVPRPGRWR